MVFVEWRAMLVHPLPDKLAIYDELLPGPYIYLTFPIFLVWAYHERRRPMWHKRLMLFALFLSIGAAVQRYVWLPMYHTRAGYWPFIAFTDIALLVPLVTFDLVTLRGRLHPSTQRGTAVLVAAQAVMLSLWGTGTDNVDLAAAVKHAVTVTNTPAVSAYSVAEHALTIMLAAARRLPAQDAAVRNGGWRRPLATWSTR